jgi:hypothetical protein
MLIPMSEQFFDPIAATVPAANNSESPGKKGVTTNPVSQNMTTKSIRYIQVL